MRRRSERKKSVEVCSPPTPASRRSRRSRKSPSLSESEKCVEPTEREVIKNTVVDEDKTVVEEKTTTTTTSRRGTRRRTPVKERTISPVSKKSTQIAEESAREKIDVIPEEENGNTTNTEECEGIQNDAAATNPSVPDSNCNDERVDTNKVNDDDDDVKGKKAENEKVSAIEEDEKETEKTPEASIEPIVEKEEDVQQADHGSNQKAEKPEDEACVPDPEEKVDNENTSVIAAAEDEDVEPKHEQQKEEETEKEEEKETESVVKPDTPIETEPVPTITHTEEKSSNDNNINDSCSDNARTRKRKWITKKTTDNKSPVLAISTDSLKNLIADVEPVPLSDVKLDSSPEIEEVASEMEEGEEPSTPERQQSDREDERIREKIEDKERERERRISLDGAAAQQQKAKRQQKQNDVGSVQQQQQQQHNHHEKTEPMRNSPSPARNVTSSILYITNLVRPFTVLQLKGLLARTGKIIEDGFWIDRIKSKCYVKYETEDEAIETRHALHGVRWPVSNPKCLNVEFGLEADMNKAVESTKEETTKIIQESSRENVVVGSGWNKERHEEDSKAKSARHVREWDVGKKENVDREKPRDHETRRSREREVSGGRENERNGKDRKAMARGRDPRSSSLSPVRKIKKTEEPPLRLLDDLFRKTKATPCIYWLPLTPEQISEKEAFRQKRIEEQKERIKQREQDKERDRDREKTRNERTERDRGRERENRRNVSNDRRRSRSRDRRRY